MARPDYDVAIIGAGPAGLSVAHALSSASGGACRVAVFERVPRFTPRGAGFTLLANGLEALRGICPQVYKRVTAEGHRVLRGRMCKIDGTVLSEMNEDSHPSREMEREWGHPWVSWAWSDLQQLLADELPSNVSLHLGEKLEGLRQAGGDDAREEQGGGSGNAGGSGSVVELKFQGHDKPVTASVVVGADGYWSKVRQAAVGDGPPSDVGTAMWRARLDQEFVAGFDIPRGSTVSCLGGGMAFLLFPLSNDQTAWVASTPAQRLHELGVQWPPQREQRPGQQQLMSMLGGGGDEFSEQARRQGEAAKTRVLAAFEPLAAPMRELIAATDPSVIVEHGLFIRPAEDMTEQAFGKGRVAIVGDAAHAVRPTGQGLNMAFEDAYHLARHLALASAAARAAPGGGEPGGWLAGADVGGALAAWRGARLPRVARIMANAQAQGAAAYKRDATPVSAPLRMGPDEAKAWNQFVYGIKVDPLSALAGPPAAVQEGAAQPA